MAKFISSYGDKGTPQEKGYDSYQLAAQEGLPVDDKPFFSFENLLNSLNAPSKWTEGILTGGSSYDKRLDEAGIRNTKGQIDLNDILSNTGRIVADPLNLVAPLKAGKMALKGVGMAGKAVGKVAGKSEKLRKVGQAAEEVFVPYAKLKRVSPQLAEKLPALETSTRAKQIQAVRKVGELGKEIPLDIRKGIGKLVEEGKGGKFTKEEALAVQKAKQFIQTNITDPELLAGISPKLLEDYFPRKAEREAVMKMLQFGGSRLSKNLGGAEKLRKYKSQIAGEKAGVIYKDPLEALAIRASRSEAARANAGFIKQLIGGEVKDTHGKSLVIPLGEGKLDGYEAFTIASLKGRQAPAEAVAEIEKYYKTFVSDDATNDLLKLYDKSLGIWKTSVTSFFPAYHLRNVLGNFSNMWLGGFKNPLLIGVAAKIQKGKSINIKGIKVDNNMLEELGIAGRGFYGADVPKVLEETLGNQGIRGKISKAVNPLNQDFLLRQVGSKLEDNARITFFIDRLRKGDNAAQAVAQVKKYLFDYGALTPFEKGIMKRLMPFYTWTRKNIPLQIENLITQPGKAAVFAKLTNIAPLTEEEKGAIPDYMREAITGKLSRKDEGDAMQIVTGIGLPFEDLGRLVRESPSRAAQKEVLATMYPWGNLIGAAADKDFFRGKDISESGYSYGRQAKDLPQFVKEFLEFREETSKDGNPYYYVNPWKYYYTTSLIGRLMRVGGRENLTESIVAATAPGRVEDISIEEGTGMNERVKQKKIDEKLAEKGALKEFKTYYVPKGKESDSKTKGKFISSY